MTFVERVHGPEKLQQLLRRIEGIDQRYDGWEILIDGNHYTVIWHAKKVRE